MIDLSQISTGSIVACIICFFSGFILCWIWWQSRQKLIINNEKAPLTTEVLLAQQRHNKFKEHYVKLHQQFKKSEQVSRQLNEKNKQLIAQVAVLAQIQQHSDDKSIEIVDLKQRIEQLEKTNLVAQTTIVELTTAQQHEKQAYEERQTLINHTKQELKQEFSLLAHDIFNKKSNDFKQQSSEQLNAILQPFNQQIVDFKQKVDHVYENEGKQHASLLTEIKNLRDLNQQLNKDAINLTRALKGDNKQQGTWGELILQKVLEQSGLRENHEYELQKGFANQDNKNLKPDVIVHLPHNKDIIIDSKVSLLAYENYCSAASSHQKKLALSEHIKSITNHIHNLSDKDYSSLKGLKTLDFVLMFIPIEPAFMAAFGYDDQLFSEAFNKKIIVVTPTTLLATLKTIENLWRYEKQNHNAREIAERASNVYNKLRGFVEDIEKLGKQLDTTHNTYHDAVNKLTRGKGNLINQAQQLLNLGVKVKKEIPKSMLQSSEIDKPSKL